MAKRKKFLIELIEYFWKKKVYWLFPIVLFLVLLIFLIAVGSSPVALFIYPLF